MVNSYEDLVKIHGSLNPSILDEALAKSEARILDINNDRQSTRSQAKEYTTWIGGCWLLTLSASQWAWKTDYDVLLAGCLVILTLLSIAIVKVFEVFSLGNYPRAGTAASFWACREVLTGDINTLCFMKARILIEHYLKSIPEAEKSYENLCTKFTESQRFSKASFFILTTSVFFQALWIIIVRFTH